MDLKESSISCFDEKGRHPWELTRFEAIYGMIRTLLSVRNEQPVSILDVGCGDLFFLARLSTRLPEAECIGLDTALTAEDTASLNQSFGTRNLRVYNDAKSIARHEPFTFILLLDVMEHVPDDSVFLSEISGSPFVSAGSTLIITVPAFQSLFCRHDRFLGHYRRYTNRQLSEVCGNAGLLPVRIGYFFFSLLLPRILTVAHERLFRRNATAADASQIASWNGSPFLTRLITTFLRYDYRFGRSLEKAGLRIPGLSNYAICRRPV